MAGLLCFFAGVVVSAILLAIGEELPGYIARQDARRASRRAAERLIAETPARRVDA